MTESRKHSSASERVPPQAAQPPYQPPGIERVVTRDDLEGEVLYAGDEQSPIEW
jgi:hypothetical protein